MCREHRIGEEEQLGGLGFIRADAGQFGSNPLPPFDPAGGGWSALAVNGSLGT